MAEVTYANFFSEAQANLWALVKNDATVKTFTPHVIDGIPLGLTQGIGFPYVIIPTPATGGEHYLTLTRKMKTIVFKMEIFDRKEATLRSLLNAVSNVIESNKVLFSNSYGMFKYLNSSGSMVYDIMEDNNVVYDYSLIATYEWVSW